jgi:hypothetical protein
MKTPVFLQGVSGVGKTEIMQQLANRVGATLYPPVILTGYEAVDLRGIPTLNDATKRTIWYQPDFLPDSESNVKGILFLDELPNAGRDLLTPCYQLLLEGRLGSYYLPKDTFVVAAGNSEEDSVVLTELPGPLVKRMIIIKVVPSIEPWTAHALRSGVHPQIIAFLQCKPQYLDHTLDGNSKTSLPIQPNCRAWTTTVNKIMYATQNRREREILISGAIGQGVAIEFFMTLDELESMRPLSEIVALVNQHEKLLEVLPKTQAGVYALIYALHGWITLENADDAYKILLAIPSIRCENGKQMPLKELQQLGGDLLGVRVGHELGMSEGDLVNLPSVEKFIATAIRKTTAKGRNTNRN